MERLVRGRKKLMYSSEMEELLKQELAQHDDDELDMRLLEATHLQMFVKCRSHGMGNGTKWGLSRWCDNELIDNLYLAIFGCKNASSDIIQCLPSFISQLIYEDADDWTDEMWSARRQLWDFFVPDKELAKKIMEINPRWCVRTKRMRVSTWVRVGSAGRQTLLEVFKYFCNWDLFSITRWAAVQRSCKLWISSLFMGLDGQVALCNADPDVSGYTINQHWKGRSHTVRTYAMVASFSGGVSEGVGLDLLKDDRFLMHAEQHWQRMKDDATSIFNMPTPLWGWCSELCGGSFEEGINFRGKVVWSSLATMAYIHWDSFDQLQYRPLCWTQGDLTENVNRIETAEWQDINDDFTQGMKTSMELGVPKSHMVDTLKLARESPAATNLVEQGHGSGAMTMKAHAQYGQRMLQARQSIHQGRAFFGGNPAEQKISRVDAQMAETRNKLRAPSLTGEHAFLRYLQSDPHLERLPGMTDLEWQQWCIGAYRGKYRELDCDMQLKFEADAIPLNARRNADLRESLQKMEDKREDMLTECRRDHASPGDAMPMPNLTSAHALDADAIKRFADKYEELKNRMTVRELREDFDGSALAPPSAVVQQLETLGGRRPLHAKPMWLKLVVNNRMQFYGVAMYQTLDIEGRIPDKVHLPLIAYQNPQLIVWITLKCDTPGWSTNLCRPRPERLWAGPPGATRFSFDAWEFWWCDSDVFPEEKGDIWVLEDIDFGQGFFAFTCSTPTLFEHYTRWMDRGGECKPRKRRTKRSAAKDRARKKIMDLYPWLTKKDLNDESSEDSGDSQGSGAEGSHSDDDDIDENYLLKLREEQEQTRAEYRCDETQLWFYVAQRGGDANAPKIGRLDNCAAMFARKKKFHKHFALSTASQR